MSRIFTITKWWLSLQIRREGKICHGPYIIVLDTCDPCAEPHPITILKKTITLAIFSLYSQLLFSKAQYFIQQ